MSAYETVYTVHGIVWKLGMIEKYVQTQLIEGANHAFTTETKQEP